MEEQLVSSVLTWQTNAEEEGILDKLVFDSIHAALDEKPVAQEVAIDIFSVMAIEVLLRENPDGKKSSVIQSSLLGVQKFSQTDLKLAKKDWPKILQDRIEKCMKDG